MDAERLQNLEERLCEQAEATWATNKLNTTIQHDENLKCQRPLMILTPNRLWNISKVYVMQDKLWKSLP
jgi:hypothetical protein